MSALVAVLAGTLVVTSIVVIGTSALVGGQRDGRDGMRTAGRRRSR